MVYRFALCDRFLNVIILLKKSNLLYHRSRGESRIFSLKYCHQLVTQLTSKLQETEATFGTIDIPYDQSQDETLWSEKSDQFIG